MRFKAITSTLVAAALLLCASIALAADGKPSVPGVAAAHPASAPAKPGKSAARVKLVDINSASKKELMTLPEIGGAEADKIVAGRPYGSKSHLTTRSVIPRAVYENLKSRVIARRPQTAPGKAGQK
jgi:DNA uptake protein ComE-like DNA-binding protein